MKNFRTSFSFFVALLSLLHSEAHSQQLVWGQAYQANGHDRIKSMHLDLEGNIVTSGLHSSSIDIDPGANELILDADGYGDGFIQKLDQDGHLIWALDIGSNETGEICNAVSTDTEGNVYVAGEFTNACDFDPSSGEFIMNTSGGTDVFILKFDVNGNFIWGKSIQNPIDCSVYSLALDASSNVFVTGSFFGSTNFDPGFSDYVLNASSDSRDCYVLKLDSEGNFQWARSIVTSDYDDSYGIATDSDGNVYATGFYTGTADFDPGENTYNITSLGQFNRDAFIWKLDGDGNFVWAKSVGGSQSDQASAITVDPQNNIWVTGQSTGDADFDPGENVVNHVSSGGGDLFILKLDSDGNYLWSGSAGNEFDDTGLAIASDSEGNIYSTGYFFKAVDFDFGAGEHVLPGEGKFCQIYIQKINNDGDFISVVPLQCSWSICTPSCIAIDENSNCYTGGNFMDQINLDPTNEEFIFESLNFDDFYILKLDNSVVENVGDLGTSGSIFLYPNPTKCSLNLSSPLSNIQKVQIHDVSGKLKSTMESCGQRTTYSTANLPAGVYTIHIIFENGQTACERFIVN